MATRQCVVSNLWLVVLMFLAQLLRPTATMTTDLTTDENLTPGLVVSTDGVIITDSTDGAATEDAVTAVDFTTASSTEIGLVTDFTTDSSTSAVAESSEPIERTDTPGPTDESELTETPEVTDLPQETETSLASSTSQTTDPPTSSVATATVVITDVMTSTIFVDQSTVITTDEPTTESTGLHTDEPTAESTELHTDEPTTESTELHTDEPATESTELHTDEPATESTELHTDEPTDETTYASTDETTPGLTDRTTKASSINPTDASTLQPTQEATQESTAKSTEESTAQSTLKSTDEPTVRLTPTDESTTQSTSTVVLSTQSADQTTGESLESTAHSTFKSTEPTDQSTEKSTDQSTVSSTELDSSSSEGTATWPSTAQSTLAPTVPPMTLPPEVPRPPDFSGKYVGIDMSCLMLGEWDEDYADSNSRGFLALKQFTTDTLKSSFSAAFVDYGWLHDIAVSLFKKYNAESVIAEYQSVFYLQNTLLNASEIFSLINSTVLIDLIEKPVGDGHIIDGKYLMETTQMELAQQQGIVEDIIADVCSYDSTVCTQVCYPQCNQEIGTRNVQCQPICSLGPGNEACTIAGNCTCKDNHLRVASSCVDTNLVVGVSTGVGAAILAILVIAIVVLTRRNKKLEQGITEWEYGYDGSYVIATLQVHSRGDSRRNGRYEVTPFQMLGKDTLRSTSGVPEFTTARDIDGAAVSAADDYQYLSSSLQSFDPDKEYFSPRP